MYREKRIVVGDGAGYVVARRRIEQSPLSSAPDVPRGTRGHIEDEDDPWLLVDFGDQFGVVICSLDEVR